MHFEILVEDQSGKKMLDFLVPKIIGKDHTFKVISYKGIGHIPKGMSPSVDPSKRILLNNLPRLLRGYGKAWLDYHGAVFVICDLDNKCLKAFRSELLNILSACSPRPEAHFCIATEEGEAWLLGDIPAIKTAFPRANNNILKAYANDSICGTWERLADAIYRGGSIAILGKGWRTIGEQKSQWAEKICPHMDVSNNLSPSFIYFREKLHKLAGTEV